MRCEIFSKNASEKTIAIASKIPNVAFSRILTSSIAKTSPINFCISGYAQQIPIIRKIFIAAPILKSRKFSSANALPKISAIG